MIRTPRATLFGVSRVLCAGFPRGAFVFRTLAPGSYTVKIDLSGFRTLEQNQFPNNVVDATPFKRDILKELADACATRGMRLGFYYSQSQDWHEPNGAGNTWDFGADDKKDYDQYLRGKAEPQVRELLTGYGPVALIWFDTPRMMSGDRGQRFADIVRTLQPNTLIDGRLGTERDYRSTSDNVIPAETSAEAWKTPATINDTWGYRTDDTNWKSAGQIAFKLVDIQITARSLCTAPCISCAGKSSPATT